MLRGVRGCLWWELPELAVLLGHPPCTPQVSHVLAALQAGNRGTQACITAASAVSGIIADLDTTIMFATAGTLNRENSETFADHRYQGTSSSLCLARDVGDQAVSLGLPSF